MKVESKVLFRRTAIDFLKILGIVIGGLAALFLYMCLWANFLGADSLGACFLPPFVLTLLWCLAMDRAKKKIRDEQELIDKMENSK